MNYRLDEVKERPFAYQGVTALSLPHLCEFELTPSTTQDSV